MAVAVGKAEIGIQGAGYAVIGVSQAAPPDMFPFEQAEKVVVVNAVIGNQGDIMAAPDLLTQVNAGHGQGVAENFHVVDAGKRDLLVEVFAGYFAPYGIEEGIGGFFSDQHASGKGRQEAEVGSERQDGQEIDRQGRKGGAAFVGDEVVGID